MNDAYYTLSDPTRRREYDSQRKFYGGGASASAGADPFGETGNASDTGAGQSAYNWAWNFFTQQAGTQQQQQQAGQAQQEAENAQFGDAFEEMLREQGMAEPNGTANNSFWGLLGGASGGALGFIVANVPGLLAGAVAGNRLGAIRDTQGKSVYAVFQVSGRFSSSFCGGRYGCRLDGHVRESLSFAMTSARAFAMPHCSVDMNLAVVTLLTLFTCRSFHKVIEPDCSVNWLPGYSVMPLGSEV